MLERVWAKIDSDANMHNLLKHPWEPRKHLSACGLVPSREVTILYLVLVSCFRQSSKQIPSVIVPGIAIRSYSSAGMQLNRNKSMAHAWESAAITRKW